MKKDDNVRVRNTPPFKLKDKGERFFRVIHLKNQFGFIPEIIIVEKARGKNNTLIVRAVLTAEELKKEDRVMAKLNKKNKVKPKGGKNT